LGATFAVIAAAPVEGAATIGNSLITTPTTAAPSGTYANAALAPANTAGGGLIASAPGVITGWAMRTAEPTGSGNSVALRVIDGNAAIATGRTQPAPTKAGVHGFAERLRIAGGQRIGLDVTVTGPTGVNFAALSGGGNAAIWAPPFPDGTARPPDNTAVGGEFMFQATIEPDADADGFGDETQDGCLGVGGPRGGCPVPPDPPAAPETQIDSGPSGKLKKPKATFTFSSPSPGATFECALDKLGFTDCSSPNKLKRLENGKHKFRVRALSAEGLIDRSPAAQSFKVKRR
jgi:hypothetical protein